MSVLLRDSNLPQRPTMPWACGDPENQHGYGHAFGDGLSRDMNRKRLLWDI
jgi:hypothetical protein